MPTETESLNKAIEASCEAIDFDINESVVLLRDVHMLIRSIYESVGTCSGCKYSLYMPQEMTYYCSELGLEVNENFFCEYFKRKEP